MRKPCRQSGLANFANPSHPAATAWGQAGSIGQENRQIFFHVHDAMYQERVGVISYSLRCRNGHEFEGWFRDSMAFDQQSHGGKLSCPHCNSMKVEKAIMAPAVAGTKKSRKAANEAKQMRQFMTGLRKYVRDNAEYVGPNFAEEARKIHYGETEERQIYGESTVKEAVELVEEGIDVAPLPPELDETAN